MNINLIFYNDFFKQRIKIGITSVDFTTVYYDFSIGLDSPFNIDKLIKS